MAPLYSAKALRLSTSAISLHRAAHLCEPMFVAGAAGNREVAVASYKQTIGLLLAVFCQAGCDPDYGGVFNAYPDAIRLTLHSNNERMPIDKIELLPGHRFAYRLPTKLFEI